MKNKYLVYQDEIIDLFDNGKNYSEISRHLIEKYCLDVQVDYFRKQITAIVHYLIADKDIIKYNIQLAKQKQRFQDLNRIERKAFREDARLENALVEYNKELISLLKKHSTKVKLKKVKKENEAVIVCQIADTHFNE